MASLARYLIRRAIQGVITLFIVTVIVFILFYFSGNPLDGLRSNPSIQPAVIEALKRQYGLDQGPEVQLYRYVINMFTFNFGWSSYANAPVISVLAEALPRTLFLFGGAGLIEYFIGILALIAGVAIVAVAWIRRPKRPLDTREKAMRLAPGIVVAGVGAIVAVLPWSLSLFDVADILIHGFLPMLALVLITAAGTILLMQTSMLEVMGEDFILTAKAKGLSERVVRKRHAARNAYLPVVTSLAISLGFVVGGAIILE